MKEQGVQVVLTIPTALGCLQGTAKLDRTSRDRTAGGDGSSNKHIHKSECDVMAVSVQQGLGDFDTSTKALRT